MRTLSIKEYFIIAFCLWHMSAVGLYLLNGTYSEPIRTLKAWTLPYVLLTSQWQKWDIFSPDPLRRVSSFRIESNVSGSYTTVLPLDGMDISWWRRTKELKILGRIRDDWNKLTPQYLAYYCESIPGVEDADIRLHAKEYVLPSELHLLRSFAKRPPTYSEKILATLHCP